MANSTQPDSITVLSIEVLQPNPFQPRDRVAKEDILELADSIKQFGVLEPLIVAETPAGFQIIAGERRWRAAMEAGLKEVPAVIKKTTPKEMLEMAIIENIQRIDLGPLERAQAFQQLQRDFKYSTSEIAKRLSKSVSHVSNTIRLLDLPDAIKDGLAGNQISEGHARAIAAIESIPVMIDMYKRILIENASVRRAEEMVRNYRQQTSTSPLKRLSPKVTRVDDPVIKEWERDLQQLLAAKSSVKLQRTMKSTKILITLQGDPEETQKDLEKIIAITKKNEAA
jgi:ParB family transcriptional regulator, chromosome partitioning protein